MLVEGNHDFAVWVTQQAYHRGLLQGEFRRTYLALSGEGRSGMNRRESIFRRYLGTLNPLRAARATAALCQDGRWAAKHSDVSLLRIAWDQIALYLTSNINRQEFYLNSLYDPAMAWAQKRAFLSSRNTRKIVSVLTPARYHCLFSNKLAFVRYFSAAGCPRRASTECSTPSAAGRRRALRCARPPTCARSWTDRGWMRSC